MRPIPQLGNYKIPSLSNVYLCGSGSHPGPGVSMAPGRNASQVILHDLGIDRFDENLINVFGLCTFEGPCSNQNHQIFV